MRFLSFIKNSFLSQLELFTIIPAPKHRFIPYKLSAWASPLIGAIIGVLVAFPIDTLYTNLYHYLTYYHDNSGTQIATNSKLFELFALLALCSLFAMIIQIIITGAIHEDGLADCADALLQKDFDSRWKVSHDPYTGVFGMLSIVSLFFLRIFLYSMLLSNHAFIYALPLAFAVSRTAPMIISVIFKHHNKSNSMKMFGNNNSSFSILLASMIGSSGIIYLFGWIYGVIVVVVHDTVLLCKAWLLSSFYNGLNGDQLGVVVITSELLILISYLIFIFSFF